MNTSVTIMAVVLVVVGGVALYVHRRAIKTSIAADSVISGEPLHERDRVFISGGYDMKPAWLSGRPGYAGTLERFVPGQNQQPAAVIRTDEPVTAHGVTGHILVMELRWAGATWHSGAIAHIELCDFDPEPIRWQDRRHGEWIESHASIRHFP